MPPRIDQIVLINEPTCIALIRTRIIVDLTIVIFLIHFDDGPVMFHDEDGIDDDLF